MRKVEGREEGEAGMKRDEGTKEGEWESHVISRVLPTSELRFKMLAAHLSACCLLYTSPSPRD